MLIITDNMSKKNHHNHNISYSPKIQSVKKSSTVIDPKYTKFVIKDSPKTTISDLQNRTDMFPQYQVLLKKQPGSKSVKMSIDRYHLYHKPEARNKPSFDSIN